jgi:threonine dehydrogenase-like Zn-dependent dehydrogenase
MHENSRDRIHKYIEVTGVDAALSQSLDCVARQGNIVLLGCTRVPTESINFYQKVHRTGVSIIGAHTNVKPQFDSYPGYWTCADDVRVYLDMLAAHRLDVSPLVQEMHSPTEAPEVFARLADEPDFPVGVFFDWRGMSES